MKKIIASILCFILLASCSSIEVNDGNYTGDSFVGYYGDENGVNEDTVFIGDSITVGLYDAADLGGARVMAQVGIDTDSMLELLQNYYTDIIDESTKNVIINLGTNDVDSDTTQAYKEIIDIAADNAPNAQIWACLIHYPYEGSEYAGVYDKSVTDKKNEQIASLKGYRDTKLIKIFTRSPLSKTLTDKEMTADDGLHLSDSSYKEFCRQLKKEKIIH